MIVSIYDQNNACREREIDWHECSTARESFGRAASATNLISV